MRQDIIAGDTLSFLTSVPLYPPSAGWALNFRLVPSTAANANIDLAAVAEGQGYRTQASAQVTANWAADTYTWSSWVVRGTESYTVESGKVFIRANPRTMAAGYDTRSKSQQVLDAINLEIQARITGGATLEYSIGNRSLKKEPMAALMALRSQYRLIVARERRAATAGAQGDPGRYAVRFR